MSSGKKKKVKNLKKRRSAKNVEPGVPIRAVNISSRSPSKSGSKKKKSFTTQNTKLRNQFEKLIKQVSQSDIGSDFDSVSVDEETAEHLRLLQILKSNKKLQKMLLEDEVLMIAITKALNEYNEEKERRAQIPASFDSPTKPVMVRDDMRDEEYVMKTPEQE